jgi:hypothetical protein
VLIVEENKESPACDGCEEPKIPPCVEYCKGGKDLAVILEDYRKRKTMTR